MKANLSRFSAERLSTATRIYVGLQGCRCGCTGEHIEKSEDKALFMACIAEMERAARRRDAVVSEHTGIKTAWIEVEYGKPIASGLEGMPPARRVAALYFDQPEEPVPPPTREELIAALDPLIARSRERLKRYKAQGNARAVEGEKRDLAEKLARRAALVEGD